MGNFVGHEYVQDIQTQANRRFSPGESLDEMIVLEREFSIFSGNHSLKHAAALLNIQPCDAVQKKGWAQFLDHLNTMDSDEDEKSAHDRIVSALANNLADANPLPVYFTWHSSGDTPRLIVSQNKALMFSGVTYLTISIPIDPSA